MIPALLLTLLGIAALAWLTAARDAQAVDASRGEVVVVARPGATLAQTITIVTRAGGAMIARGRFANVVVASSPRARFADALRREGAWAVIASPRLAGCVAAAPDEGMQ
jgi:hypothetical protein